MFRSPILTLLVSCSLFSIHLKAQSDLQKVVNQFSQFEAFQNGSISVEIIDAKTKESLASVHPNTALPPASTTKLFSTASAFYLLGANYRPSTKIYITGPVRDGVLYGDIIIKGGGDPTVGSRYFYEDRETEFLSLWCAEIKAAGILSIIGKVIADGSSFGYMGAPDDWTWSDMGNYYGSGPSGISVYDNMLKYYFKTGAAGDKSTLITTFPLIDSLRFLNNIFAANITSDNSYIFGAPFGLERIGTGRLPANKMSFTVKGSLPDPEYQLAKDFYNSLINNGVGVGNGFDYVRQRLINGNDLPNYSDMKLVYTAYGKKISEIAELTNYKSINHFAEQLVCLIGYEKTYDGSSASGLEQIEKLWRSKIDTKGLHLSDGSGLSRSNAISASHFCQLLAAIYNSENYLPFKNTLPVAGVSGTIASLGKNTVAKGRVFAKSGSMNRIKSYAGYVQTLSGRDLTFAIILNNYTCTNSIAVDQIEKVLEAMVKQP